MELISMQHSPTPFYFLPQQPILENPHPTLFLLREQDTHPHKTTGKIIVHCVLIFLFSNSKR